MREVHAATASRKLLTTALPVSGNMPSAAASPVDPQTHLRSVSLAGAEFDDGTALSRELQMQTAQPLRRTSHCRSCW